MIFLKKQKQGGNVTIAVSSSNIKSEVLNVSSSFIINEWILDFGCSFHMSFHIELFQNFNDKETGTIFMGNNHSCSIKGIGDISFKMHDNNIRMFTRVRYVPELKRNLISLGTLDELGYAYKAENGFLHIFKNDKLIFIWN